MILSRFQSQACSTGYVVTEAVPAGEIHTDPVFPTGLLFSRNRALQDHGVAGCIGCQQFEAQCLEAAAWPRPVAEIARRQAAGRQDIHKNIGHTCSASGGCIVVHVDKILGGDGAADDQPVGDGDHQIGQRIAFPECIVVDVAEVALPWLARRNRGSPVTILRAVAALSVSRRLRRSVLEIGDQCFCEWRVLLIQVFHALRDEVALAQAGSFQVADGGHGGVMPGAVAFLQVAVECDVVADRDIGGEADIRQGIENLVGARGLEPRNRKV